MPTYSEFYLGETKTRFDQKGVDSTDNLDVFSEFGTARCQYAMTVESTTPSESSFSAVMPGGDIYFCSKSTGKIWKRTQAGVFSLVHTNTNTTGHTGCRYYNGYLYFWTASKLGRFNLSSTWTDTFGTFSNGKAAGHEETNLTLYICDGKYIASVNSNGTFQANALDFPANYVATCCVRSGLGLLVGTQMGNYVTTARSFFWDTFSDSWLIEDEIYETGINFFIKADNIILCQAGESGKIYAWGGESMEYIGKIRSVTTGSGHQMATVLDGKPLIAIGTDIYSFYKPDLEYPFAIVHEYTANNTIASISTMGSNIYVSYAGGVEKIGTNRATAKFVTPETPGQYTLVEIGYSSLPAGTSIGIETSVDGAAYVSQTSIVDTINKKVYFDGGLPTCNFMQSRITLNPSGSSTPIITYANVI